MSSMGLPAEILESSALAVLLGLWVCISVLGLLPRALRELGGTTRLIGFSNRFRQLIPSPFSQFGAGTRTGVRFSSSPLAFPSFNSLLVTDMCHVPIKGTTQSAEEGLSKTDPGDTRAASEPHLAPGEMPPYISIMSHEPVERMRRQLQRRRPEEDTVIDVFRAPTDEPRLLMRESYRAAEAEAADRLVIIDRFIDVAMSDSLTVKDRVWERSHRGSPQKAPSKPRQTDATHRPLGYRPLSEFGEFEVDLIWR